MPPHGYEGTVKERDATSVALEHDQCARLGYRWARMALRDNLLTFGPYSIGIHPLSGDRPVRIVEVSRSFWHGAGRAYWENVLNWRAGIDV